jgi:hypothetical protein
MNSRKINDWLQIGGQFAVLAGLIFVGLQLNQDREIAKIQVVAEAANKRMYWAELIGQGPEVWVKGLAGQPLSATETGLFDAMATAWELSHFSFHYTTNHLSNISTDRRFVREWVLELRTHPGLLKWWHAYQQRMAVTSAEDRASDTWALLVEEEMAKIRTEPDGAN